MVKTPRKLLLQNLPLRDRPGVKEPRGATFKTGVAFDKNKLKSVHTLAKYRTGYRTAWAVPKARKHMLKCGFKEPDTYKMTNQQGGVMFSLPRDIPRRFKGEDAGKILRFSFKHGLTRSQCDTVRAMLSFAYQLQTGKDGNFDEVKEQWRCQHPDKYRVFFLTRIEILVPRLRLQRRPVCYSNTEPVTPTF